jgi:hypothetical protein
MISPRLTSNETFRSAQKYSLAVDGIAQRAERFTLWDKELDPLKYAL